MSQSSKLSAPAVAHQMGAILVVTALAAFVGLTQSRSFDNEASVSAVIPSPNQVFGDGDEFVSRDLQRTNTISSSAQQQATGFPMASVEPQEQASNEASVPVYVSPFERAERSVSPLATMAAPRPRANFDRQESSQAPPNYAPRPPASAAPTDLKTSASYGHHHHGHYGHDHSGWLDMGAWTGGKGSFGWYADYPVGGGKHHGYGKK